MSYDICKEYHSNIPFDNNSKISGFTVILNTFLILPLFVCGLFKIKSTINMETSAQGSSILFLSVILINLYIMHFEYKVCKRMGVGSYVGIMALSSLIVSFTSLCLFVLNSNSYINLFIYSVVATFVNLCILSLDYAYTYYPSLFNIPKVVIVTSCVICCITTYQLL